MSKKKTKTEQLYDNIEIGDLLYINCYEYQLRQKHTRGGVPALIAAKVYQKGYFSRTTIDLHLKVGDKRYRHFYIPNALYSISKNKATAIKRLKRNLKSKITHYRNHLKNLEEKLKYSETKLKLIDKF